MKLGFNDPFGDYLDGLSLSLSTYLYIYILRFFCFQILCESPSSAIKLQLFAHSSFDV